jgi:paraquat-inducible protein B
VLIGGVAFDTPQTLESSEPVEANHVFKLYESLQEATAPVYERKERYVLYFDDSVRGLKVGAPVEFRGIRIGEVIDFRLEGDSRDLTFRIPVLVELEPDRIHVIGPRPASLGAATQLKTMEALVNKGLRAQLKTGSLLTGDLYVDFDFYPEAQQAKVQERNGRVVLPTVPTSMEELRANAMQLLAKLQRFPLDEIGADLRKAIQGFTGVTDSPELKQAIANLDQTLAESRKLAGQLNTDLGPLSSDLARALDELSAAARSIRVMADYLERHPDALIKGKRRNR